MRSRRELLEALLAAPVALALPVRAPEPDPLVLRNRIQISGVYDHREVARCVVEALRNNTNGILGKVRAALGSFLLAAGLLCGASVFAQEPPATGRVSVGAAAVWSESATVRPAALVEADAPINLGDESVARVLAQLRLAGVQGQTVNPADVATFSSLQFDLYIKRRIGSDSDGGSTYVYLHGGGAALRDSEGAEPFQRTPLWYSAGLTLERREGKAFPHRWVSVGFGHSDVSSPPRRQPGTLRAAARDAIPRDLIASGSTSLDPPGLGSARVILTIELHRALWGPRGTMHVQAATTLSWS